MTVAAGAVRIGLFAGEGTRCAATAAGIWRLLAGAGATACVHAAAREAFEPALAAGARWCATPAALAASCDVLCTVLATPADAEALLAGPEGLEAMPVAVPRSGAQGAGAAGAATLLVDMGTLAPGDVQAVAARLAVPGIDMVDVAAVGEGALRAGGSPAAFDRARPVLAPFGTDLRHVGAIGAGRVVGCCHRIVESLTIEAVAEAMTLARRLGADPARVRAALAGGFAASHVLDVHGARMLSREFIPGLEAGVAADALGVVVDEAHRLGLDLPGSALVAQHMNALMGAGDAGLDSAALVKVLERMAGEAR